MRNFNARFRLRDNDRHIRFVYTLFLLLMLVGFGFSFLWAHSMTGLAPQGIADHYRGSDATFGEPMSFRELAEITHFHLFTMPVVFMILIHVLDRLQRRHAESDLSVADPVYLADLCADHAGRRWAHAGELSGHAGHSA